MIFLLQFIVWGIMLAFVGLFLYHGGAEVRAVLRARKMACKVNVDAPEKQSIHQALNQVCKKYAPYIGAAIFFWAVGIMLFLCSMNTYREFIKCCI